MIDVDECPHSCGANSLCHNTLGSYQCECKFGFIGDPYLSAGCVGKSFNVLQIITNRSKIVSIQTMMNVFDQILVV